MNDARPQATPGTENVFGARARSKRLSAIIHSWWTQAALLLVGTLIVYRYAFFDVARADQLIYLYRTVDMHGFWNLTIGSYDFNRTHSAGDFILFRPILFMLLGLERWLWGYNFLAWQATSIGLHILVIISLFSYFRYICKHSDQGGYESFAPFVFALYFAFLYAGTELVAWHLIVGYLLFCLLSVQALFALQRVLDRRGNLSAVLVVLFSGLACFTYELGNALAGLIAAALFATVVLERWRGKHCSVTELNHRLLLITASLLLILPVAYVIWSYLNYVAIFGTAPPRPPFFDYRVISLSVKSIYAWTVSIFVPGSFVLRPGGRITSVPSSHLPFVTAGIACIAAVCALILVVVRKMAFNFARNGLPALVTFLFSLAYTLVISAGRGVERGEGYVLINNSYYAYIFALFVLLGLFYLVVAPVEGERASIVVWARGVLFLSITVLAVINGEMLYQLHEAQYRTFARPISHLIRKIETFKTKHGAESDFSFTLGPDCGGVFMIPWFADQALERHSRYTIATALFPRDERASDGKYTIHCTKQASAN